MDERMTIDEINKLKYVICCPLCDEPICVIGSSKCEAEIWKKEKLEEQKLCSDGKLCTHPNCKRCGTTHFMSECDYGKEQKNE